VHLKSGRLESRILEGQDVLWHQLNGKEDPGDWLFHKLGFKTMLAAPIWGRQRRIGLLAIEAGEETDRIVQAAKPLIQTFTQISGHAYEALFTRQGLDEAKSQFATLFAPGGTGAPIVPPGRALGGPGRLGGRVGSPTQ